MSGIVDLDVRFPRGRATVEQMQRASGLPAEEIRKITLCEEIPVLGPDETAWEIARDAAAAVLDRTGVDRAGIRHVLYAGSGVWDRPAWSPAAKIAHELGIDRAHCFEVGNFCNAGMTALQIACEKSRSHGGYVLVLLGDRLGRLVDYRDATTLPLFNAGDAGGAILVGPEGYAYRHLHAAMRTDASWADFWGGEQGPDGPSFRYQGGRKGLSTAYMENFEALAQQTLDAIDRKRGDIAYLLINQGDRNIQSRLLTALGLAEEQSVFTYGRLGHMASSDTVICLKELAAREQLQHGDLILVASSGMGFSFGVTALEYCAEGAR
ncbi:3-oxoacyl-[acyl-carrier-protein] synthase III C-terminal domain-containing protein [Streptomyces roseifaciens]